MRHRVAAPPRAPCQHLAISSCVRPLPDRRKNRDASILIKNLLEVPAFQPPQRSGALTRRPAGAPTQMVCGPKASTRFCGQVLHRSRKMLEKCVKLSYLIALRDMKAVVAGATGRTGRAIVARLVEEGVPVNAIVRDRSKAEKVLPMDSGLITLFEVRNLGEDVEISDGRVFLDNA